MVRNYRKRTINRRRRFKKRRKKRNIRFYNKVNKIINGVKRFKYEQRGNTIESGQDTIVLSGHIFGDYDDFTEVLNSTLGQSGDQLGGDADVTGMDNSRFLVYNQQVYFKMRNMSEHAIFLSVYEVVVKHTNTETAKDTTLMNSIESGLDKEMATGTSTATDITGEQILSRSNNVITTSSEYLQPYHSTVFNRNYRIVKMKHFKLAPGDDVHWPMKIKNFVYNDAWVSLHAFRQFRNVTKGIIFKVRGAWGHGNVSGTGESSVGCMNSHFASL